MSNPDYILINFQRITITLFCFTLLDSQIFSSHESFCSFNAAGIGWLGHALRILFHTLAV